MSFCLVTDEFSGYRWVLPLKKKSDANLELKNLFVRLCNGTKYKISGEFISNDFKRFLQEMVTTFEGSESYTPQQNEFAEIIVRLSALTQAAPEITEMDINPMIATEEGIISVDCRIKIEK